MKTLQRALDRAIRRYQRAGGGVAVFGVDCNFEPTCSEYLRQAVARHGLWRGLRLGLMRLRRCTDRTCAERRPDPVPEPTSPQAR